MLKKLLLVGLLTAFMLPAFVMAAPSRSSSASYSASNESFRAALDLSDAQKQKAAVLRMQSRAKIQPYMEELRIMRSALREMNLRSPKARKLRADMERVQSKIEAIQLENERQFVQILTPAQKSKYNKLKEERRRKIEAYTR